LLYRRKTPRARKGAGVKTKTIGGPVHFRAAAVREKQPPGTGMGQRDTKKEKAPVKDHSAAPGIFGPFCPVKKDSLCSTWDGYPMYGSPRMDIPGDRVI